MMRDWFPCDKRHHRTGSVSWWFVIYLFWFLFYYLFWNSPDLLEWTLFSLDCNSHSNFFLSIFTRRNVSRKPNNIAEKRLFPSRSFAFFFVNQQFEQASSHSNLHTVHLFLPFLGKRIIILCVGAIYLHSLSSFFFFLPISFKTKITFQHFCVTNQLPHLLPHFAGNFSFVFIQIEKGAPKKTQDFWTFDSTDFAKVIQISSLFLCFSSIYFPLAFLIGK